MGSKSKRVRRTANGLRTVLVALGCVTLANAKPAAQHRCSVAGADQAYQAGKKQGRSVVEAAWQSTDQKCNRLRELSETIERILEAKRPRENASRALVCRMDGFVEAARARLSSIRDQCR